jgi:hypothetical protein
VIINEDKSTENKKEEPTETGKEEELDARLGKKRILSYQIILT